MLRLSFLFVGLFGSSLLATNQIQITGVVQANANTQLKTTYVDGHQIQQDILIQTNHRGLTLSLTPPRRLNMVSSSHIWLNSTPMSNNPLDFSNNVHAKPTRVGELIISKNKNKNSYALTVAVK